MRKLAVAFLIGPCLAVWGGAGCSDAQSAAGAQTGRMTVVGKVIDLACYTMNEQDSGMDHITQGGANAPNVAFNCAYACVRWQGMPAGLLTDDGRLYQIAGGLSEDSNSGIAPHLTHTVTITGDVIELDGVMLIAADEVTMVSAS